MGLKLKVPRGMPHITIARGGGKPSGSGGDASGDDMTVLVILGLFLLLMVGSCS
jgi:hypothetical protein